MSWPPEARHDYIVKNYPPTILQIFDACPWFKTGADWTPWRAFLAALYGLPMSEAENGHYRRATGRIGPHPTTKAREAWVPTGRRARKTAIAALVAVYEGLYRDHSLYLAPGERAVIPMMAKSKKDAEQLRDYVLAILRSSPAYSWAIESQTVETIRLKVPCDFDIRAATITSVRGRSVPVVVGDEIAFWHSDDYANPDKEIIASVMPAQSAIPNPLVLGISSPYARRGILYERFAGHYGQDGNVLVWKAPTLAMHDHPGIKQEVEKAYEDDPVSASAEYGAEFRADVHALVSQEIMEPCIVRGRYELLPEDGVSYVAFVDPSGGQADSAALGIAHWDNGKAVLDLLREWRPPFAFDQALDEIAVILARYGITGITGDAYGLEITQAHFRRMGVPYHVSDRNRSEIYRDLLPLMNSGKCELLDIPRLHAQLLSLERKPVSGREKIDHPANGHDDAINAAAGALVLADKFRRASRVKPVVDLDPKAHLRAKLAQWSKPKPKHNVWGGSRNKF